MKVLNLYAGLGGNRKKWEGVDVTAVEHDPRIAAVYQRLYPDDEVIVADAHEYLLENYHRFKFIWSSPPCQRNSRMVKATRHKHLRRYPDLRMYEEAIFLDHYFDGLYAIENVVPYYKPLMPLQIIGRHAYLANFDVGNYAEPIPKDFINLANLAGKKKLMDWLGIHYDENIYYGNNHCPAQILRNCVHPNEGLSIFQRAMGWMQQEIAV